jgi:acetyl-CoA carboxylase biotin carboxyl carrier protein
VNINAIEKLARIVQQYQLTMLDVTEGESRILIQSAKELNSAAPAMGGQNKPAPMKDIPVVKESAIDFNDLREIKSPMVGVFYCAASPEARPFVTAGSVIKKGDVLCIIEAMKLMNEIQAETDGQIVDICVSNGDVVEFGQTLFKIV